MVEIALSLAIIGFALVAIIGILPTGMNVQKENREETIINQDASMLMEAIRNGTQGMDDLTNSIFVISNYVGVYHLDAGGASHLVNSYGVGYTHTNSSTSIPMPITNGFRIVGLLSTPKYIPVPNSELPAYISNHVVAFVRAISGAANEKFPQNNPDVGTFNYRLISDVVPFGFGKLLMPYSEYNTNWADGLGTNAIPPTSIYYQADQARLKYAVYSANLVANLRDVRLTFRWPLYPSGNVGSGRQVYQTRCCGSLTTVEEQGFGFPRTNVNWMASLPYTLYFLQPNNFVKGNP